jgi:hypothetical protein
MGQRGSRQSLVPVYFVKGIQHKGSDQFVKTQGDRKNCQRYLRQPTSLISL